jgi:hypothetical protein
MAYPLGVAHQGGRPEKATASSVHPNVLALAEGLLDEVARMRRPLPTAPLRELRGAVLADELAKAFEVLTAAEVTRARETGIRWVDVGDAFGIRKQTAQARFAEDRSQRRT